MVIFALDSSAVLRYTDNEAGVERIEQILQQRNSGLAKVVMCALHWGETVHVLTKRHDPSVAPLIMTALWDSLAVEIVPATRERAERAAIFRRKYELPFADSFGVELAAASVDHQFVTADFDFMSAQYDYPIEFLPPKPKP